MGCVRHLVELGGFCQISSNATQGRYSQMGKPGIRAGNSFKYDIPNCNSLIIRPRGDLVGSLSNLGTDQDADIHTGISGTSTRLGSAASLAEVAISCISGQPAD